MTTKNYYLKQNIQVEPIVNNWYAWSFLISPATTAMVIVNSHMKIMNSYIKSPEMHESSVKKPELLGGPFIDYETRQIEAIEALVNTTKSECAHIFEFVNAVNELSEILKNEADGHSLERIYPKVPEILRGYVELVYDLSNQASFRFIEGLLYDSPYFMVNRQSVLLSVIEQDYRPFLLSTPRIHNQDKIHIKLPFCHDIYDKLFMMKEKPETLETIESFIEYLPNKEEINRDLFLSFFTIEPPHPVNPGKNYTQDNVRIRYYGHACLLIETKTVSILIDPIISYKYDNGIQRYSYDDLPDKIDYLVITHGHQDHVMLEHLLQLRYKVGTVIVPKSGGGFLQDPSLKLFFKHFGYTNVIEIDDMEIIDIPGGSITGLPFFGEHSDLNIQTKKAHLITLNGKTILCAADSNNIEPKTYEHIQKKINNIDILFIGMECDGAPLSWLYGSLLTIKITRQMDQSRRLDGSNYEKAMDIVKRFNCRQVYVYAMGQEPWLRYILSLEYHPDSKQITESNKLVEECNKIGIKSERLFGIKEINL